MNDQEILSIYSKSRIKFLSQIKEVISPKHEEEAHLAALKSVVEKCSNFVNLKKDPFPTWKFTP